MEQEPFEIGELEVPRGTLRILLYLHKNENVTVTKFIRDVGINQRTAYSALEKLQGHGLVCRVKDQTKFPLYKYYYLTEKGDMVAKQLELITHILIEDPEHRDEKR